MAKIDIEQLKILEKLLDEGVIEQVEYDKKVQQMVAGKITSSRAEEASSKKDGDTSKNNDESKGFVAIGLFFALIVILFYIAFDSSLFESTEQREKAQGNWKYDHSYSYVEKPDGSTDYSDSYDCGWVSLYIRLDKDRCYLQQESDEIICDWSINQDGMIKIKGAGNFDELHPELADALRNLEYHEDNDTLYSFIPSYDTDKDFVAHVFER